MALEISAMSWSFANAIACGKRASTSETGFEAVETRLSVLAAPGAILYRSG